MGDRKASRLLLGVKAQRIELNTGIPVSIDGVTSGSFIFFSYQYAGQYLTGLTCRTGFVEIQRTFPNNVTIAYSYSDGVLTFTYSGEGSLGCFLYILNNIC